MVKLDTNEIIQFFELSILAVANYLKIDGKNKTLEVLYFEINTINPDIYIKLNEFIQAYWNYQCEVIKLDEMELNNSQGIIEQKDILQNAICYRNRKREILQNALKDK